MIDSIETHMSWDTSETENWETFVVIIWFNHLTDFKNCTLILIVVPKIMKRACARRITI